LAQASVIARAVEFDGSPMVPKKVRRNSTPSLRMMLKSDNDLSTRDSAWFASEEYAQMAGSAYSQRVRYFDALSDPKTSKFPRTVRSEINSFASLMDAIEAGTVKKGCWARAIVARKTGELRSMSSSPQLLSPPSTTRGSSSSTSTEDSPL